MKAEVVGAQIFQLLTNLLSNKSHQPWHNMVKAQKVLPPWQTSWAYSEVERTWMMNNSIMIHEPKSTLEATQQVVKILDAKYEKADLNAVVEKNCSLLSISNQSIC
jgi:hypothetical protein